jgi:hypothetical protein
MPCCYFIKINKPIRIYSKLLIICCRLSMKKSVALQALTNLGHECFLFYITAGTCKLGFQHISAVMPGLGEGETVGFGRIYGRYNPTFYFDALQSVSVVGLCCMFNWSWQWREGILQVVF